MSEGRWVAGATWLGLGLGLVLAIAACRAPGQAKDSPAPPMPPSKGGAERDVLEQRLDSDDIDQLEAELERARSELLALDDERAAASAGGKTEGEGAQPGATPPLADAPSRCERVAALAGRICQLRDRMCALATEHDQQPRYAEACGRAEQTCAQAEQAAEDCAAA